jgi:hypothetical protein
MLVFCKWEGKGKNKGKRKGEKTRRSSRSQKDFWEDGDGGREGRRETQAKQKKTKKKRTYICLENLQLRTAVQEPHHPVTRQRDCERNVEMRQPRRDLSILASPNSCKRIENAIRNIGGVLEVDPLEPGATPDQRHQTLIYQAMTPAGELEKAEIGDASREVVKAEGGDARAIGEVEMAEGGNTLLVEGRRGRVAAHLAGGRRDKRGVVLEKRKGGNE